MQYASEDLKSEHDGILFGLQVLEKMAYLINEHQQVDDKDLNEMVFFCNYSLTSAIMAKRKGCISQVLEKAGIQSDDGLIAQLLKEHTEGRKHIAHMQEATGQSSQLDEFVKAANRYVQLMRGHIEKENLDLFRLGDSILPSAEQMRILNAFEIFEEQVMGAGTHDKLHRMLDRFERSIYNWVR